MPHGGTVQLDALAGPARASGIVRVHDTDRASRRKTWKRVFEPFFTTKGKRGTGLGLAQVHSFMQQVGGEVRIVSTVGKGEQPLSYSSGRRGNGACPASDTSWHRPRPRLNHKCHGVTKHQGGRRADRGSNMSLRGGHPARGLPVPAAQHPWLSSASQPFVARQRMLCWGALAEGEEPGSNLLQSAHLRIGPVIFMKALDAAALGVRAEVTSNRCPYRNGPASYPIRLSATSLGAAHVPERGRRLASVASTGGGQTILHQPCRHSERQAIWSASVVPCASKARSRDAVAARSFASRPASGSST